MIVSNQHCFCKGKLCLSYLLEFFGNVHKVVDKGELVELMYLDFQKAFDNVLHKRLLKKVSRSGVRVKVFSWSKTLLGYSNQKVGLNDQFS